MTRCAPFNEAETLLAVHLRELGIAFCRQHLYAHGRRLRADFAFPKARLLVEVQGGVFTRQAHGSITGVKADNDRLNAATLNRWRVLRFTPDEVKDGRAKDVIQRALAIAALDALQAALGREP